MGILNPTQTRLSPHFLLSDMMGCATVYTTGFPNVFNKHNGHDERLANGKALCEHALEPILALVGPISISYGFICPELSREIVTYQDWRKPSHHRWDLGAAVDICPHNWVQNLTSGVNDTTSPIEFALRHLQEMPLSRLITYSESPYICVAVSDEEVRTGKPRMAWYENRFQGKAGAKPDYRKYPSETSRSNALKRLEQDGMDVAWEGRGYPSYHGGGRKQLHHIRVSRYTMLTDWLYDEQWVTDGVKNIPPISASSDVWDAFIRAGEVYDTLIDLTGLPRFSIVSGYTSPKSAGWIENHDWRGDRIEFELVPPAYKKPSDVVLSCLFGGWPEGAYIKAADDRLLITIER